MILGLRFKSGGSQHALSRLTQLVTVQTRHTPSLSAGRTV